MKKAMRLFLCIVILSALLGFTTQSNVKAESYSSYVSGFTLVNLGSSDALVDITYYRGGTGADAGQIAGTGSETIAAGAVFDYAAIPVSNFRGAVVIASSSPLASISTLTGGGLARGSYVGVSKGSKTVRLPFLAKNHGGGVWNTFVAVQNLGLTDTTVTIDYASCAGTNNGSQVIKPGSSVIFDQKTTACLPKGITSATITSTVNEIAAVVDQESTLKNSALVSNGFPTAGTANIALPLINANNPTTAGWRTAITIMNNGNQSTNLKLTYKRTNGTTCYEKQTIPAGQSKVYAGATLQIGPGAGVQSDCEIGAKVIGAAYVADPADNSASQPLVAIVNQDRGSMASAYGSFDPSSGTPRVIMPLIMDQNGKSSWSTSFNVMNVGSSTAYVKCTFAKTSYSPKATLAPNGVFEDLQGGKLGVKITTGQCTAYTDANYSTIDTTAKLVAVVNERGKTGTGDLLLTYEAVNVTP
jgi:hypothetical protein